MTKSLDEVARSVVDLGLWDSLEPFNFAICPFGTAIPYFCTILRGDGIKARLLLLEGWQTMHDYVRLRIDHNFGFYQTPSEMPHYELVDYGNGEVKVFRHDPGYLPVLLLNDDRRAPFVAKLLWQAYGVMLKVESDSQLPLRFVTEKAVFARVETAENVWEDRPLTILDPRHHVENVCLVKEDVTKAKDLPIAADEIINLDFALIPNMATSDKRPRSVYGLKAVNAKTGALIFDGKVTIGPEGGLRDLWEGMPTQVLKALIKYGKIPSEIRVSSGRTFRMLRAICIELPIKISLHDELTIG